MVQSIQQSTPQRVYHVQKIQIPVISQAPVYNSFKSSAKSQDKGFFEKHWGKVLIAASAVAFAAGMWASHGRWLGKAVKKQYKDFNKFSSREKAIHNEKVKAPYKVGDTVLRPWGGYKVLQYEPENGYLTKELYVAPGQQLSVQSHAHRSERYLVLQGEATVLKGKDPKNLNTYTLKQSETIDLPVGTIHSIQNNSPDKPLVIVHADFGKIIREDDIIRYSDPHKGMR